MNDTTIINSQTLSRDASLNTLMYLRRYYSGVENGTDVNAILAEARRNMDNEIQSYVNEGRSQTDIQNDLGEDLRKLEVLENAIHNDPALGKMVIANQTERMVDPSTGRPYEDNGISACTFQDDLKNPSSVIVVFRGTSKGEWFDNGIGLSGKTGGTDQQNQATAYFNYIVETNQWDQSRPDINVTGHSKGGNKTQYVVMTSSYSDLIVSGYSLDGQGMSQEEIDYMRETLGEEEFERRRAKLFSISADNDYVNVLGINNQDGRLVPDDHIFFLESNLKYMAWHYPDCYMNEDGTLARFTEQGEISKMIQGLSETTMDLPAPIRRIITEGAMGIAQMTLGGNEKPVNGESFSYADVIASVPLLIETIPGGVVNYLGDSFGINLDWLANAITASGLIVLAPINMAAYGIGKAIDLAILAAEKVKQLGQKCKELTEKFVKGVENSINKLQSWVNSVLNPGSVAASSTPVISLDTYKLRLYADRIQAVNNRVQRLDDRMDSLYRSVNLRDLWNLLQADLMTSYSWRLTQCVRYLVDTASDFESVERKLTNS